MDNLVERHILHALAIAKCISFKPETKVLDLGTGGGFPGIPLSILFPEVEFLLIDGTGKKIAVVQDIIQHLQLNNVKAFQARAEDLGMPKKFDFVVSRAVAPLDKLLQWSRPLLSQKHKNAYPNGLFALKGGDLKAEIQALPGKGSAYTECIPISSFFIRPGLTPFTRSSRLSGNVSPIVSIQFVALNDVDQLGTVGSIRGVTELLQPMRPLFIIITVFFQRFVAPFSQHFAVRPPTFPRRVEFSEEILVVVIKMV